MTISRRLILLSAFLLMLGSAFADNLRGSLIPLLHQELQLGFATVGGMLLTVAGFSGAAFNAQLLGVEKKFGPRGLIWYGAGLLIIATAIAFNVTGMLTLGLLAIPLGGAITVMGTSANLLLVMSNGDKMAADTELHFDAKAAQRARMMAGLHLMYGVGSLAAPATAVLFANRTINWPRLFFVPVALAAFPLFAAVTAGTWSHPNDQKPPAEASVPNQTPAGSDPAAPGTASAQWFVVAIFLAYVTGEVLTSMWMPSFLIHHLKIDYAQANKMASAFFVIFSLARLSVFLGLRNHFPRWLVYGPLLIAGVLMVAANLIAESPINQGRSWLIWAFPAAGMIGPFFPMMLAHVSTVFHQSWQRLTVIILTSMQIALALSHVAVGTLFDTLGPRQAYLIPPMLLIAAGMGAFIFMRNQAKSRFLRANP